MHASRAGAQNTSLIELCFTPYQQYFRDIHAAQNTWTYLVGGSIFPPVTSPWWHNASLNLTIRHHNSRQHPIYRVLWSLMDTNNPDTSPFRMILLGADFFSCNFVPLIRIFMILFGRVFFYNKLELCIISVLRSAKQAPANVCRLNNISDVIFYCSVAERSRARSLCWRQHWTKACGLNDWVHWF